MPNLSNLKDDAIYSLKAYSKSVDWHRVVGGIALAVSAGLYAKDYPGAAAALAGVVAALFPAIVIDSKFVTQFILTLFIKWGWYKPRAGES